MERFPCLWLALEAGKAGGTYPAVLSAADEVAVELFLGGCIRFMDIPRLIEETLKGYKGDVSGRPWPSLEAILEADALGRALARELASA
mgnify:CR=1 FL=1